MYRVIAIVGGGLALAACSSTADWLNLSALKPGPIMDTVRFESTPPGADAKTSNGQTCKTPCALVLPADAPLSVTFALNGYLPDTETLDPISSGGGPSALQPNPVMVELEPAPPPPVKPVKKPAPAKKKPAAKPTAAVKPAPAPMAAAPAPQPAASPWPAPPAPPAQQR